MKKNKPMNFLLIAFDADLPKDDKNSMHKAIDWNTFRTLREDVFTEIDLNQIRYQIVSRSWSVIRSSLQPVAILILDVKRVSIPG